MSLKHRMKKIQLHLKESEGDVLRIIHPGGMVISEGQGASFRRRVVDWDGNPLSDDNKRLYQYGKYSKSEVDAKIEQMSKQKGENETWIIDDIPRGDDKDEKED